jgi:hypothetical protein
VIPAREPRKRARGLEAAIEIQPRDDPPRSVGQQRLLAPATRLLLASAEDHVVARPRRSASSANEAVETRLALIFDFCPSE